MRLLAAACHLERHSAWPITNHTFEYQHIGNRLTREMRSNCCWKHQGLTDSSLSCKLLLLFPCAVLALDPYKKGGRAQQLHCINLSRIFCSLTTFSSLGGAGQDRCLLRKDERWPGLAEGAHRAAAEEGSVPTGAASMSSGLPTSFLFFSFWFLNSQLLFFPCPLLHDGN